MTIPTGTPLRSNHSDQNRRFARAFAVLEEAIGQRAFPGSAIAVTHRSELVALRGFGRFTYDRNSPEVHADTVFDLASVTKVVAATTMAMLLYERGTLDLCARVASLLPEFGSDGDRKSVTVQMLLAHSSGLPAYIKLYETAVSRDELLHATFHVPLAHAPGTHAEYSDIGFILLAEILERLARESLGTFTSREVFMPLEMSQTCFNPSPAAQATIPPTEDDRTFRRRIIQGEVNDENAFVMGGISAHAGLFAPAIDIARFAECMLRGGAPILKPETVELFTRRELTPLGTSRALGWDTPSAPSSSGRYFSPRSFGHLGYTGTSLWIDPERQLSVTLLTNRTWPDRSSQAIRQVRPVVHDAIVEAL